MCGEEISPVSVFKRIDIPSATKKRLVDPSVNPCGLRLATLSQNRYCLSAIFGAFKGVELVNPLRRDPLPQHAVDLSILVLAYGGTGVGFVFE